MASPIETPEQAGQYLETLINIEKRRDWSRVRLSLDPVRKLLERLGNPHEGLSILHVAGSKGKGSTCLFAEAALGALGKRVGVFTSPHLSSWTERFRVGGRDVEGDELARAVNDLRPHVEWLREHDPEDAPTFFDATTAAALLIFARADLDYVILEVGLGGRLDSTNIVDPRVCAITTIELEHTDKLGNTIAEIAAEKAGIIKPGIPCYVGRLVAEAEGVIHARARELAAPLFALGKDFEPLPGDVLRTLGRHQEDNAGLALACVSALVGGTETADEATLARARAGIGEAELPGRVEVLGQAPLVIVDAAHTEASARELALVVAAQSAERRRLLLSVSEGKAVVAILGALLPHFDEVFVTRAEPHRSLDVPTLARAVREQGGDATVHEIEDPNQASLAARDATAPGDLLVAAGSIYLAGVARKAWG